MTEVTGPGQDYRPLPHRHNERDALRCCGCHPVFSHLRSPPRQLDGRSSSMSGTGAKMGVITDALECGTVR
jgi:hypothetical protein